MNKEAWLKFLRHSTEAHHIREIFLGTYALIELESVQKQFFDRINHLQGLQISEHTRTALENLREDIEDEIETGKMRKKIQVTVRPKENPFNRTNAEELQSMIDKIRYQLDAMEEMIDASNQTKVV